MLIDRQVIVDRIELRADSNFVEDSHDTSVNLCIEKSNFAMGLRICSRQNVESSRFSSSVRTQ